VAAGVGAVVISVLATYFVITYSENGTSETSGPTTITSTTINLKVSDKGPPRYFRGQSELFDIFAYEEDFFGVKPDGGLIYNHLKFVLKDENAELYEEIGNLDHSQKTLFIAPIFTMTAYSESGFYDFYKEECDESCIKNIPIAYKENPTFTSSGNSIKILTLLGYPFLTDIEIDKHPEILKKFDKVIVLHNEYVTKKQFDAITKHPKVIYLSPNALYAEIEVDYEEDVISLVRGHNYPEQEIRNGFDWEFDNSELEYDHICDNWEFYEIKNGLMLNCYPEQLITQNATLLRMIKEY